MAGHFRGSFADPPAESFPDRPQFSGFMKPCRFEGEWFNGDGNVSAFRFHNGNVDFQQKFVRTEKRLPQQVHRRRRVQGAHDGQHQVYHFNGSLLAIKEDAPPYRLGPNTLETLDLCDFDGQLPSCTFTAHPKMDPVTGELVCFGYQAKGDGTPDVCYFSIGPDGNFLETVWLVAPVVGMIHDFAITDNWVLFPMIPQICHLERLKAGGEHWQWDPNVPFYLGVMPRRGAKGSDVKTPSGTVVFDLLPDGQERLLLVARRRGQRPGPARHPCALRPLRVRPRAGADADTPASLDLPAPTTLLRHDMEFPRIDERVLSKPHRHSFFDMMDPALGTDFAAIAPVLGGGHPLHNALGHLDRHHRRDDDDGAEEEPVFVPRSADAPEGDGFVIALVNNYGTMSSELHVVDTRRFSEPAAVVKVAMRLRAGLHGNWVDAKK
ncbi:Lignostilbene-alpha,beta-dioxygenase isozyme III, partial [Colletotrichum shisoi]